MDEEHFWQNVDKSGECWTWTGLKVGRNYGKVYFSGKTRRAHRVSWELAYGSIPEGMDVCHKCDNPPCVRPDHLFLGTAIDNNADKKRKGRQARGNNCGPRLHPESYPRGDDHYSRLEPERLARGSHHGNAKLSEAKVRKARNLHKAGTGLKALGAMFGVSKTVIYQAVIGKTWAHVK